MNDVIRERLYQLLPELYRWRDQQQGQKVGLDDGGPLRAFLAILDQELDTLEIDMEATYDNWFIQTSDNWAIPYIADLLGIDDEIVRIDYLPFTQRRRVANTLAYRRRKGVVAILEQVLWDVTNWHIRAVEFYQLLATTEHLQHLRPGQAATVDVGNLAMLAALDTPFTKVPRTVEVRMIEPLTRAGDGGDKNGIGSDPAQQARADVGFGQIPGKYQRNNLGLYFWRLRPYPISRGYPCRIDENYFTFHPMGRDRQIFNRPRSFQALTQQAGPINMPIKLTRRLLAADLRTYASSVSDAQGQSAAPANSTYYGPDRGFNITLAQREEQIPPSQVISVDLSNVSAENKDTLLVDWSNYAKAKGTMLVAVDPQLGRFALLNPPESIMAQDLRVDYTYGFSADVGGGPYPRRFTVADGWNNQSCEILIAIGCENSKDTDVKKEGCVLAVNSLSHALYLWSSYCDQVVAAGGKPRGLLRLLDNGIHDLNQAPATTPEAYMLWLPPTAELTIVAEDGTQPTIIGREGQFIITFERPKQPVMPMARGLTTAQSPDITIPDAPILDRKLVLNGVGIQGCLVIDKVDSAAHAQLFTAFDLVVEHCTILDGGIQVELADADAQALTMQIQWSISGPLRVPATVAELTVTDSIIDYQLGQSDPEQCAIAASLSNNEEKGLPPGSTTLERCTIFGKVAVHAPLWANGVLFNDPVTVHGLADAVTPGDLHFCYIPAGSKTPPCERCLHKAIQTGQSETGQPETGQPGQYATYVAPPQFTSQQYGHPGYGQLAKQTATEIKQGVGGIAEIGVFCHLYQPQREANIRRMLDEYLPLGLNTGIFYVS